MWRTIFTFIFFCAGGSHVYSILRLKFVADPKEPLVGTGNKGDKLKMTCIGYIKSAESNLVIDIFQILNEQKTNYIHNEYSPQMLASTIDEEIGCCATQSLCEGFNAKFWYKDGNLTIEVIIAHLQCVHHGQWTCAVTYKSVYETTKENTIELPGFSPPSDVQLTARGVSDTGTLIAISGTNIVFTCEGNVGSPYGHFVFETTQHRITSETNDQEVFDPTEESDYNQIECLWSRRATLKYTVLDTDDHKSFKCIVRCSQCEHENSSVTNTIIKVLIVNTNGTTWHALDNFLMGPIDNPLASNNESSSDTITDCSNDVWLIFGVAAGGIVVLVVILESIYYLHKKKQSLTLYSF